jgi:hypothetical protein
MVLAQSKLFQYQMVGSPVLLWYHIAHIYQIKTGNKIAPAFNIFTFTA